MRELPAGTVTLLFTDVEGSTKLLAEHGDAYAELLAEHRRLLREAFDARGGAEVDTQGDAFFYAFARASDAAAAAADGQAALAATPVRVRMGLHTGEPQRTDEGYVGMDVHRGARIAAVGHGGQVLVSEQTARLLDGAALRDLGPHRLKDVGETRIHQLGDGEFPPLKSLYQSNLPTPSNPLIGRKKELVDVMRLLAVERARVVTLTGPGGIGKTRFSIAVASEVTEAFADGTWFVDLSPLRDPALVLPTVAATLGAHVELHEHIGDREVLVVLDNLEQVVDAAGGLGELVDRCPRLQVLGTSREVLRIAPEREYPLKPLPESPAVELFRQRAHAAAADSDVEYELAAAICDRVDRLPLAIELAAARVRVLEPVALLERLDQRLPLLSSRSRDLPERQRTLHSTIAWSYELLDADEQKLFRRLAVFAGGMTAEAGEAVCEAGLDLFESLVDKSLVRRRGERFLMLETIREFAAERLAESREAEEVRSRHAEYFLGVAESTCMSVERIEGGTMRHDLALAEQDNFRGALDWAVDHNPELGLRIAVELEQHWVSTDPFEGARRIGELLERALDPPDKLRAPGLRVLGGTTQVSGDEAGALPHYEESLALYERLGSEWHIVHLRHRVAVTVVDLGDWERARTLLEENLVRARALRSPFLESEALGGLSHILAHDGDAEGAIKLARDHARLAEELGFTWFIAIGHGTAAEWSLELDRLDDAEAAALDSLAALRTMGDQRLPAWVLTLLAIVAHRRGDDERAGRLWGAVEVERERVNLGGVELELERLGAQAQADGPAFEAGREAGRRLSLEQAMDEELAQRAT